MAKKGLSKENYGYLFILPFFLGFLIFSLYPIIYSFYISFMKWDGMSPKATFIGLKNYSRLIVDPTFREAIANTFIMWGFNVVPQMVIALILAVILNNQHLKGKDFFRAIYYLPNLVTPVAIGVLFVYLFDWQSGAINNMLISFHIFKEPVNWLIDGVAIRGIVSFTQWWMWFGYSSIIFMAGLKNIPEELYEACKVDGATGWQTFWKITLPLLKPTILYSVLTSIIGGMQLFDIPNVIMATPQTNGRAVTTMVSYLYNTAFQTNNYGYGASIGYGLFVIIFIFAVGSFKIINRNTESD
ncbi:MAG: carbohydrate ABC transporter permease [Clostridium sp.]